MQEEHRDAVRSAAPDLSVVMPAYNAAPYIERAIDSIMSQTFRNLELVIIDDASTDATWNIVSGRAALDDRIRAFRNETNLGVSAATNRGVELAKAPLIGRMDADDISDPTRFEKQVDEFRAHPHYAVLGTYASHTNEEEQALSLSRTGPASEAEYAELRAKGEPTMVFGGTALFTKELFERVGGYDPRFRRAVDLEFFDRMSDHGPVVALPEPLLLYRLHPGGIVSRAFFEGRQIHRFVAARRRAALEGAAPVSFESFADAERRSPLWRRTLIRLDDLAQFHYREAGMAYGRGNKAAFAGHFIQAFLAHPLFVVKRVWDQRLSPSARASL